MINLEYEFVIHSFTFYLLVKEAVKCLTTITITFVNSICDFRCSIYFFYYLYLMLVDSFMAIY